MSTADLILEILNEEIPSRMQSNGVEAFKNAFVKQLNDIGLSTGEAYCYMTPRRISLHISGIPVHQEDRIEEKRGPRVGAPEAAIEGFLSSTGLATLDDCEARVTDKGEFWFAKQLIKGLDTAEILPQVINEVIRTFVWPKSMRWGRNTLAWVRPIRGILCMFNDQKVVGHLDLGYDMVPFTNVTKGHRFMSKGDLSPISYMSYLDLLLENYVILKPIERRAVIFSNIMELASKHGLTVRHDEGLLDEVCGLVEWPIALLGKIEPEFMCLPEEVLITSMRVHQRYFALEEMSGKLAPYFILISNVDPTDGGQAIVVGNERVLRARLSDAKFFFEQDQKKPLEDHGAALAHTIFQDDLGDMAEKTKRMVQISGALCSHLDISPEEAQRAALLSKCDLMTQMVGEFPELQGIMGYYYSKLTGESPKVAEAIADQYRPKGFLDEMPRSQIGRIVALSDRIDTLVGFFAIGIKPTGSKDPYALRRSAIACIRLLETMNGLRLDDLIASAYKAYESIFAKTKASVRALEDVTADLKEFFFDRLKAYWKEKGVRHDYLDAVFSVAENDALEVIGRRIEALNKFLSRGDETGEKLLAAYRRASNIVRIEEKKDQVAYDDQIDQALLMEEPEKDLFQVLRKSTESIKTDLKEHNFEGPMTVLSDLRPYIDKFFDQVTVNCEDPNLRLNRLKLLSLIRNTLNQVADFSKLEG